MACRNSLLISFFSQIFFCKHHRLRAAVKRTVYRIAVFPSPSPYLHSHGLRSTHIHYSRIFVFITPNSHGYPKRVIYLQVFTISLLLMKT